MTTDIAYIDSSAFVKLIAEESETAALRLELDRWARLASCSLLVAEVTRTVLRAAPALLPVASRLLAAVDLIAVTRPRLQQAGQLQPPQLRTLDALHLVSAMAVGARLGVLVTYDRRIASAAQWHGVSVVAPS